MDRIDIAFEEINNLALEVAIEIVGSIIFVIGFISLIVNIILVIKYVKYNRRENSAHLTGEEVARKILDKNGLQHIRVRLGGFFIFGNGYSHYFKTIFLRIRTRNKTSLTSLAMGAQKSALAVLDKENDPDMKKRIRLFPVAVFGTVAFIPLILIGFILDYFLFSSQGYITLIIEGIAIVLYLLSLVISILMLSTEKKAQQRAYVFLRDMGLATEDEIATIAEIFNLYNIQYINDIILSTFEILYYILKLVADLNNKLKQLKCL